ncbi:protein phosphatase 2C-like domain-containing protein 1 [Spea bombifrons]|uniref:protein phosphatase 2C-like domain-containing protein 1 n=1 Tax=Spea bombifrons TaxID=233779 RepID=UPI00234A754B|nr:protein phosphatase 2C-like domain-containing protein 1 [Spea bombifrons]
MRKNSFLPNTAEKPISEKHELSMSEDSTISDVNDVLVLCSTCQLYVAQHLLLRHKQQHRALTQMGYKFGEKPINIDNLTFQRSQVLSKKNKSSPYKQRNTQKINHYYETLKRMLSLSTEYSNAVNIQDFETPKICSDTNNCLIRAIVTCSGKNTSWQGDMEDTFTVLDNYGKRENTTFVGLFDGYNGTSASSYVSVELPILFLYQLARVDPSYNITGDEKDFMSSFNSVFKDSYKEAENNFSSMTAKNMHENGLGIDLIHASYAKAFWRMDRILKLGRNENSASRWSGCTAVTCLIDGFKTTIENNTDKVCDEATQVPKRILGMLHIANVGNIKSVLCQNGKSYCLTKEHSTSSSQERNRVIQAGGSISYNEDHGLVEGFCYLTRGLGFHGDTKLKKSVIPAPSTISIPVYDSFQFLVLASSGLWDVLSDNEIVATTKDLLESFIKCETKPEDTSIKSQQYNFQERDNSEMQVSKPECQLPTHNSLADNGKHQISKRSIDEVNSENLGRATQNAREIYSDAAAYACKQLVKTAALAGSQQNITVCLILFSGCDNI